MTKYDAYDADVDEIEDADVEDDEETYEPWRLPGRLDHWIMRLLYALLAGTVINLLTGIHALGDIVAVMLFVISTVIVAVVRPR